MCELTKPIFPLVLILVCSCYLPVLLCIDPANGKGGCWLRWRKPWCEYQNRNALHWPILFGFCFDTLVIFQDKIKIFVAKYYCVRLHSLFGVALAAGLLTARYVARWYCPRTILTQIHWTWNFDLKSIKIQEVTMHAFESIILVGLLFN